MTRHGYVLVTPVRDEEATIGGTIESVLQQTMLPREWIIVSDGSVDRTHEIIRTYARTHAWMRLVEVDRARERSFATVVHNTELGVRRVSCEDYEYLGLLDGDVTFERTYFEQLVGRFERQSTLGLAGGVVYDVGTPRRTPRNRIDVPGAVQFYRRTCFESLGGLCPVPEGGWDALSCVMARMNGFQTELFVDLPVDHHKPRNIAHGGPLRRKWQMGQRDYAVGYGPVFEFIKCVSRATERPLLAWLAWWAGYCSSALTRRPRVVSRQVIAYIRHEQRERLRRFFVRAPRAAAAAWSSASWSGE
jgi:glycosyltransferase involved in cell wall biosynthesis